MNNDTPADAVTVTQADRDAAATIGRSWGDIHKDSVRAIAFGEMDSHPLVQAFARHRTTSLAAQEPVAMRYDFDGYGWKYIDNGSGTYWRENAWLERHPDAEPVYAAPSLAAQDGLVKHMANRFLGWKLPENFHPDNGISFKPTFNDHMDPPMRHNPIGTNLFNATQAEEMVRYMLEGYDQ